MLTERDEAERGVGPIDASIARNRKSLLVATLKNVAYCINQQFSNDKSFMTLVTYESVATSLTPPQHYTTLRSGLLEPIVALLPFSREETDMIWSAETTERVACYPCGLYGGMAIRTLLEDGEWEIAIDERFVNGPGVPNCIEVAARELGLEILPFPKYLESYAMERSEELAIGRIIPNVVPQNLL